MIQPDSFPVPSLPKVWNWYNEVRTGLIERQNRIINLGPHRLPEKYQYFGLTPAEVRERFDSLVMETEYAVSLSLLVAAEAAFFQDYERRENEILAGQQDAMSLALYKARQQSSGWTFVSLLAAWDTITSDPEGVLTSLRTLWPYRDWLAHGRR
jgi:hypothetical protein